MLGWCHTTSWSHATFLLTLIPHHPSLCRPRPHFPHPHTPPRVHPQGDIVMRQGDIASEMYFIAEGTLEVRLYEDDTGKPLANTSYSR